MQQGKKKRNTADGSVSTVLQVSRDNILKITRRNLRNIYLFVCFTFKVRFLAIAIFTDWQTLVFTIRGQPGTTALSTHDSLLRAEAVGAGPCEWGRLLYFWTGDQFCGKASRWAECDLTDKASVQRGQQSARCLTPIDIEPCRISGDHRSYEKVTLGKGWGGHSLKDKWVSPTNLLLRIERVWVGPISITGTTVYIWFISCWLLQGGYHPFLRSAGGTLLFSRICKGRKPSISGN